MSLLSEDLDNCFRGRKCVNKWYQLKLTILRFYFSHMADFYVVFSLKIPTVKSHISPGWCGAVELAPGCGPKGPWFNSQSGHMPGLQAQSPVGGT